MIRADNLGKQYRLGETVDLKRTFRELLGNLPGHLARRLTLDRDRGADWFWALKDINLEIRKGEAIGIIGRNGSGKSTLLKIMSRITAPTTGRIEIHGRVGSLLEIGTGFHPELTGSENIYLNGSILGMRKHEISKKFDEIVDFAGTEMFLDTPVKRYSSGMRIRLGFAVAAHLEPEVLIVDEVLSVGDSEFRRKCLDKMGDLTGDGRTILFVSHNMSTIHSLCDSCIVMEKGAIRYHGPQDEAISCYQSMVHPLLEGVSHLSNHSGRSQDAYPILKKVSLLDDNMDPLDKGCLRCGSNLNVEVQYHCPNQELDYAAIGINSPQNERILTVTTHNHKEHEILFKGHGKFICRIPSCPLAPGGYDMMVAIGTINPVNNVDIVNNAMSFVVEPSGIPGLGPRVLPGQGYIIQPSEWFLP